MGDHLIDEKFQSDKYRWCHRGFVPLKLTDPMAVTVLWHYFHIVDSARQGLGGRLKAALLGHEEYESVEHPWCKPGFVPMELADPQAQPVLWNYAGMRECIDKEFSGDLREALRLVGYRRTA